MREIALLEKQAGEWGLPLGAEQTSTLAHYARLLAGYQQANVIGTRDTGGILIDHILDSLSCFLFRPFGSARRLADVGSGGGLPGIPIKILRPGLEILLIESTAKKVRFLEYALRGLELRGIELANQRAEELARQGPHRAAYDVVTARAVAPLAVLAEYCVPLLRIGGYVVAMKGLPDERELAGGTTAAEALGAKISEVIEVPHITELESKNRRLVILEKVRDTPRNYPRRPGMATKRPLDRG